MANLTLRMASAIVKTINSDLMRRLNGVQELVQNPMRLMVQQVIDGIWVGKGADAFVQEMMQVMIPRAQEISEQIAHTHRTLVNAVDLMERADQQVKMRAENLGDVFSKIVVRS